MNKIKYGMSELAELIFGIIVAPFFLLIIGFAIWRIVREIKKNHN